MTAREALTQILKARCRIRLRAISLNSEMPGSVSDDEIDKLTLDVLYAELELARYLESAKE